MIKKKSVRSKSKKEQITGRRGNTNKKAKAVVVSTDQSSLLFKKVVAILESARSNVVRTVNNSMVIAYWLIGKEIVQAVQGGEGRAEYGKKVIKDLSEKLTKKYGKGFSTSNLWYFRQFYQVYSTRKPEILHKVCGELSSDVKLHKDSGVLDSMLQSVNKSNSIKGFSASLSWSHYRTLSKVENKNERLFYEIEAEKENWSIPQLERQINSFLFVRLLKSKNKNGVLKLINEGNVVKSPADAIKEPYILDFLGLSDIDKFHETELESAIITHLKDFLLELGKGFAFVARQKRIQFGDEYFYMDLVFYNCILKCYLLIDLKIGKLTHQDIGQMDSYVRMFDDLNIAADDNPTIGLILCSEKNEVIAKYSVLKESKQIFASKYMLYLPSEDELKREIKREKKLIDEKLDNRKKR
ncbi:MAG: DUF1016 family protein [Oligoflexia bacterium]|nr:DUF1016 family protein [Oligoflexia bacterium]